MSGENTVTITVKLDDGTVVTCSENLLHIDNRRYVNKELVPAIEKMTSAITRSLAGRYSDLGLQLRSPSFALEEEVEKKEDDGSTLPLVSRRPFHLADTNVVRTPGGGFRISWHAPLHKVWSSSAVISVYEGHDKDQVLDASIVNSGDNIFVVVGNLIKWPVTIGVIE